MQDLKNNFNRPFEGMTIILGGDFTQILHIVPNDTKKILLM